jgi:LPXTG-motif cell wall-anchored protein
MRARPMLPVLLVLAVALVAAGLVLRRRRRGLA